MAKRDYYEVLGVDKKADEATIKKAYRKIAIKYHPDRQGDKSDAEKAAAEEKFKEAAEAYAVLSDSQKRQQYDQFGFDGPQMGGGGFGGFGGFDGFGAGGFSMDDIFEHFGSIFGGRSGYSSGSSRRSQQRVYRGSDLRLRVKLTLEEINEGVTKKFKVNKDIKCPHCNGSGAANGSTAETCSDCGGSGVVYRTQQSMFGMIQSQTSCPTCGGEGKVIRNKCQHCAGKGVIKGDEVVEVAIPAGVAQDMVVTARGKGNAGPRNGVAGDIQVFISEEEHEAFIRDGQDLLYNLLLDIPTATLGGQVEIPTIEGGKVKVKIESGTQPGKTLRLRGKGLPNVNSYNSSRGDMLVCISVYIPKALTKDERKQMEQFAKSDSFKGDGEDKKTIFERFKNLVS